MEDLVGNGIIEIGNTEIEETEIIDMTRILTIDLTGIMVEAMTGNLVIENAMDQEVGKVLLNPINHLPLLTISLNLVVWIKFPPSPKLWQKTLVCQLLLL